MEGRITIQRTPQVAEQLIFDGQWTTTSLLQRYNRVSETLQRPHTHPELLAAFDTWEDIRRNVASWKGVVEVRTRQDVNDPIAYDQSASLSSAAPLFEASDTAIKRLVLQSPHRHTLESRIGSFVMSRWALDLEASDSRMRPFLEEQALLGDRYTRLLGGMQFSLDGRPCTQSELTKLQKHPDRSIRREATFAKWAPFNAHAGELDEIFDGLVRSRTRMAGTIDEPSFTLLAYRRLGRLDYSVDHVRALRQEIRKSIVPIAERLVASRRHALNIETFMPWDEWAYDNVDAIPAHVSIDILLDRLSEAYRNIDPDVAAFAKEMRGRALIDVQDRPGKAPGAFCEQLPHLGMPFVFANVTGTPADAFTIAHEMGHAFQFYRSQQHRILDLIIPTNETAEIHSLSMEFLLSPHYINIVGSGAEHYFRSHIRTMLMMLPYIAAVDEFQEMVYEHSGAGAGDRRAMWREIEALYMPWRQHGDIPALVSGGAWQAQRHVYRFPFYYIDYAIAMCCALQIWQQSRKDHRAAVERYLRLCDLGGSLPFTDILRTAHLESPFERGTLTTIARDAAAYLSIS